MASSSLITEEVLKRVKLIELSTKRMVDTMMSGQYKTHFKGHGVQFSEHRVYVPGDDVRHIDWKVSARTRDPLVRKYEEERELDVFLVVDGSASKRFGSSHELKSQVAAQITGLLAYAAIHSGDRVGLLIFSGKVEKIVPPKRGRSHLLRLIRDVLTFEPSEKGTALAEAMESTRRVMKHSGIVFVLSDFLAEKYPQELKRLSLRHEVVGISILDPKEIEIPRLGRVLVEDPETGARNWVDTSSYRFQEWMKENSLALRNQVQSAFKLGRAELLEVKTDLDYLDAVVKFFLARKRSKGRVAGA